MRKEDINLIAQLLTSMKESTNELEKAHKKKDAERLALAKKEILRLQKEIDKLI